MEKLLTDLDSGEEAIITAIRGRQRMRRRLHSQGLVEGQLIRLLSALAWGGPIIVLVDRAQVAIGRGMARKILVRSRNA